MTERITFKDFGLSETTLQALTKKGFEEPTSIQKKCIPLLIKNTIDIVGQAQTGTGKTAAFGIPIIEMVKPEINKVQALILTPTRELAIQVAEEINSLKGAKRVKVTTIYGGQSMRQQIDRLREGVQVVVGTPGRVIDHMSKKRLRLDNLKFFILDEADEMLNMGFIDDVEDILNHTPREKRMLLFSATMPKKILNLAKKYMPEYQHIEVEKQAFTTNLTDQIYFEVRNSDKFESLSRIIDVEPKFYGIVFCRTKIDVDAVTSKLSNRGYNVEGIHGDIVQNQREKIFSKFKSKKVNILVATDVAARGIDVIDLTHVINYSLPQDPEGYIHRIGRTGRAGKEGTAITFITPNEYRKLLFIQRSNNISIRKEKLPDIKDVMKARKDAVKNDIKDIIHTKKQEGYHAFASEILESGAPQDVVAALLTYFFEDDLNESKYNKIEEVSVDKKGKTRLFIAIGKHKGVTRQSLVQYITSKSGVKGDHIQDVEIYDKFSFANVHFEDGEIILRAFKKNNGSRSLVMKAKGK